MLAYVLAWVIGLGSLGLYLAAFFFPEIHRKNDFIWSGLGLFYALILWVYAERLTGGILLGQTASVALLSWFGWETLTLRRQVTPSEQRTQLPDSDAARVKADLAKTNIQQTLVKQPEKIAGLLTKAKDQIQAILGAVTTSKGKASSKSTQIPQSSQSTATARVKQTIEKDRLEVAPPPAQAVTDEAVIKPDQEPADAASITEEIKPEVEITPSSSSLDDTLIDEWDRGEPPAEVNSTVKGSEPNIQTKTSQNTQAKAATTKESLQAKLANLPATLTNLPIRDRWNKVSEQTTSLFASVKDQVQGVISKVTQRKGKSDTETPQQVVAPSIPTDPAAQDSGFNEDEAKGGIEETTSVAAVIDEVVNESTPVAEALKPETDSESAARLLTRQAATGSEAPAESEVQPDSTSSDLNPLSTETEVPVPVEEIAPEAELAPPAEPPGQPREPEPSIEMEVVPPEATFTEPQAPTGSTSDSESLVDEEPPELIKPNRPDPSLVEAAKQDTDAGLNQDSTEGKEQK